MSNRQELADAINHRKPARIPYTIECTRETSGRLRQYLGLAVDSDLGKYFECNSFDSLWSGIGKGFSLPERMERLKPASPDVRVDIWGIKREQVQAGDARYWEISESPLAECATVADIENYDWPVIDDVVLPELPAGFDLVEWKRNKFVMDMSYICPFGIPWAMRGMENLMMDLYLNPEMVEAIVRKVEEYTLACLEAVLKKYPGAIDMVGCGDDYGTQNGLLIAPDAIQKFFMPSLKRHYELAAKYGVGGYHHCCGAIFEIIPMLIDAGVQVLNPVQTSAKGMSPVELKKEFGKDLCFHGGIDTQETLVTGTPDDVKAEVRSRIDVLGPEGYILGPSHVLQADVDPANIVALFEEAKSYGAR